jgi:hypothetical protein
MHRLFVPEPLKRQRNLEAPADARSLRECSEGCCRIAAAFMLQKTVDFPAPLEVDQYYLYISIT